MKKLLQPDYSSLPAENKLVLIATFAFFNVKYHFRAQIPLGFKWDGASIPRFLWSLLGGPFHPDFIRAGCSHDYLYRTGILSRLIADKILLNELELAGVGWFRRKTIYRGVRAFGWAAWNKHRKKK